MPELILKPGREKSLLRRHPWVFSGSISRIVGHPKCGDTVEIKSSKSEFLARGAYSPRSKISARVWTWQESQIINSQFFRSRLNSAISLRDSFRLNKMANAYRIVNAESDGIPGFILDRYGHGLVFQSLCCGSEKWYGRIINQAKEITGAEWIYERSDAQVRALEGLEPRTGWNFNTSRDCSDNSNDELLIEENNLQFIVDIKNGHKTGFYLDQRENRKKIRQLTSGRRVLDCFSYTGGFTVNALKGGASSVTAVDNSSSALALLARNVELNGYSREEVTEVEGDVFKVLRSLRDQNREFDLIILDPPKFAPTASTVEKAARGYKDINLLALKLLSPGGLLATFSCSGGVSTDLFQKIIAGAAVDASKDVKIITSLRQGLDHPVSLNFPEGNYLKGFIVRVSD